MTLVDSVAVVDQENSFVVSGTNATVRTTRARLVLRDFSGVAVGTVGSTFSYTLDGDVNLFIVGVGCGVALSGAKTQTQQQSVQFISGGGCNGLVSFVSRAVLEVTDDGSASCVSCDRSVAAGAACDIRLGDVDFCVPEQQTGGLCY